MSQDAPGLSEDRSDFVHCLPCGERIARFSTAPSRVLLGDYLREGACELSCENGRKTLVCLQNFFFEIHFEIGALALLDGYYAESTFAFAKALERFYEFCIKLFTLEDSSSEEFNVAWGAIENQSERQLGAFIFLYLKRFKESPLIFSKQKFNSGDCAEFRNRIIHKGYLPSKDEAFRYGKLVFEYIQKLIVKLRKEDGDKIQQLISMRLENLSKKNEAINSSTMSCGLILSQAGEVLEENSFERELEKLEQKNIKLKQLQESYELNTN